MSKSKIWNALAGKKWTLVLAICTGDCSREQRGCWLCINIGINMLEHFILARIKHSFVAPLLSLHSSTFPLILQSLLQVIYNRDQCLIQYFLPCYRLAVSHLVNEGNICQHMTSSLAPASLWWHWRCWSRSWFLNMGDFLPALPSGICSTFFR